MKHEFHWSQYLDTNHQKFLSDFKEFLSIPSISTLPEHKEDIRRAAHWLSNKLSTCGLENVEILETDGHPVVYADWVHANNAPTVLLYGHYDVQPVDPIDTWDTPPFEPALKNGYIYARGANDMKGNVLLLIHACESYLETTGKLPVNVKFLIEGEEELMSPSLPKWLEENRGRLTCDFIANADAGQTDKRFPTIVTAVKGALGVTIDVITGPSDLHSGLAGGIVHNALHIMSELISSFHDKDTKISITGFYDDVLEPTKEERELCAQVPFNHDENIKRMFGVRDLIHEDNYTPAEVTWFRPNLAVHGLWGGFQGSGFKTIIPCEAHAKLSIRLVANQDPSDIFDKLERHIHEHIPTGVKVTVSEFGVGAKAYTLSESHPALRAADEALKSEMKAAPVHVRMGAAIPILATFKAILGVDVVTMGFGNGGNIHAPNEHQNLAMCYLGARTYARFFELLGTDGPVDH
ncbi:dipeptidase [Alicyclobacillus sp. SO9]|uniref:dipeptidase n=1 Tax=Alicyclobacillus sp. SO9 TaxID=2665646 RepID=UPI0018E6DF18|nr:dipeptidase [Alicyclobacillus sp. SO9]QQE78345.1 dipeptidase [Alicyclobacillus sp. SO9]